MTTDPVPDFKSSAEAYSYFLSLPGISMDRQDELFGQWLEEHPDMIKQPEPKA